MTRLRAMKLVTVAGALALIAARAGAADVVKYYHLDGIGNVRVITNARGAILERHDYLPFGEECTTGPCANNPGVGAGRPRKFTSKERDPETGFDYFGARYYGSKVGRSNYHMWGTRPENGQEAISHDAVPPEKIFRVPPQASLVWRTSIKTPDIGAGPATIRGMFHSSCSLWSGSVVSDPVTVTIRPGSP